MANSSELNDIAQLLPTAFIEQITLDSKINKEQTNKNLLVNVSLSLKDVVEKDDISEWFTEQDLQKFIKFHSLLITSKGDYENFYNFTGNYGYEDLKFIIGDNPYITEKILSLPSKEQLVKTTNTTYSENYITDNDDGTKEITIPLSVKYEIPFDEEQNRFLSLLCFLTFDLKAFAQSFNIDGIKEENALSKSFTSQIIIDNGQVVSETQYFILPDGSFYYGQFHVEIVNGEYVYKTGVVETESSVELQLVTDTNNIICDFRARKYFDDKTVFDSTGVANNIFKTELQIKKILDKMKSNKKEFAKYFSDTLISLDEQGNCRFSFFFDKKNFAIDNSFYPILFQKNPSATSEQVRVKNITVYRIRKDIKEINSSSENVPVIVAQNSTNPNSKIDVLQRSNLPFFNGSYIIENNVEGVDHSAVKNYSVYDAAVSKINYGLYKYKIVVEIIDSTRTYLEEVLKKLTGDTNSILPTIQEYYNLCLTNKKITVPIVGDATQNKVKYTPYFDSLLGKFIPDFTNDNKEQINIAQKQLTNFLVLAEELGYYSFNTEEEIAAQTLFSNLLIPPSATPDSVGLVLQVIKDFVKKLQDLLGTADSQSASNTTSKYKNNIISFEYIFENSSTENIANTTEYNIDKTYDSYFNAAVINGVGYKVLNNVTSANSLGFNSINISDYKKLTDFVSKKYFNDFTTLNLKQIYGENIADAYNFVDEFDNDDSKYSYLPVASVGTINKKYDFSKLSEQFFNQEYYENIFLDILNYNTLKQSNFSNQEVVQNSSISKEQQIIRGQLLELFSDPNFTNISIASEEPVKAIQPANERDSLYNIFGKNNSFDPTKIDQQVSSRKSTSKLQNPDTNIEPNSMLLEILLHEIINNSNDLNNVRDYSIFTPIDENGNKNGNFFIDKVAGLALLTSFIPGSPKPEVVIQNYIRQLPLPLKLLLIARGNIFGVVKAYNDSNDIKDATIYVENFFKYWINFKKLYRVEYFDKFENNNLKSPTWLPLTINKLKTSESNILCRVQKHKMEFFEEYFPDIPKLEMPLFDKYFYIVPDNRIDLLTSIQKAIQNMPKPKPSIDVQLEKPRPDKIGPISMLTPAIKAAEALAGINDLLKNIPALEVSTLQTMSTLIAPTSQMDSIKRNEKSVKSYKTR